MKRLILVLMVGFYCQIFAQSSQWTVVAQYDPFPTSFYSEWQQSQSNASVTVNYTGTARVEFKVRSILKNGNGREIARLTSPVQVFEAGPAQKIYFASDFLAWSDITYDNTTLTKILRTNRFPEGDYVSDVKVLSLKGATLGEGTGSFTIIYPSVPMLMEPQNGSTEERQSPIFTWTTVNIPPTINFFYNIKIVKKFTGQTNNQALETNPVQDEANVSNLNTYVYPLSALSLENGAEYVWRIRVVDANGNPLTSNDGNSEFWSFIYNSPGSPGFKMPFSTVDLEKGVAWFEDFSQLKLSTSDNNYVLNGTTTLKLKLDDGEIREFLASVEDLTFQKNKYAPFYFSSGKVTANLNASSLPESITGKYFKPVSVEYNTDEKVVLKGNILIPNAGKPFSKSVKLPIKAGGVIKEEIKHEEQSGLPLVTFGNLAANVNINSYKIVFPGGKLTFSGEVKTFSSLLLKSFSDLTIDDENLMTGNLETTQSLSAAIVPKEPERYSIKFSGTSGNFKYNFQTGESSIDIKLSDPKLVFNTTGIFANRFESSAGFSAKLSYSSLNPTANGFQVDNIGKLGTKDGSEFSDNPIKFSDVHLVVVKSMVLDSILLTDEGLDFRIRLRLLHSFPGLQLHTSEFEDIPYSKIGITMPSLNQQDLLSDTENGKTRVINGIELSFKTASRGISVWNGGELYFDLGMQVKVVLQNFPSGSSSSLHALTFTSNAKFSNSGFTIDLSATTFTDEFIALPSQMKFMLTNLKGSITGILTKNEYQITSALGITGNLALPEGVFGCSTPQTLNLSSGTFVLDEKGNLTGRAGDVSTSCPVKVGLFSLSASAVNVEFTNENNTQQVVISGSGKLDLTPITGTFKEAKVNFVFNPAENLWKEFSGAYSGEISLNIPRDNPVFKLKVNNLQIAQNGITIDGRHSVIINEQQVGNATARAIFSFNTAGLERGSIILDNGFAIGVDITDGNKNPKYSVIPKKFGYPSYSGVVINTAGNVTYKRDGFSFSQTPDTAYLRYKGSNFLLQSYFSSSTKATANPFKISSGRIDLILNDNIIGNLTPSGLTISESIIPPFPEELALLNTSIGKILTKDINDNYLVDYKEEGSNVRVKTIVGRTAMAIFPVFRGRLQTMGAIPVTLDILVNKTDYSIIDGTITAEIPADQLERFDLNQIDIPVKLKNFTYAKASSGNYEMKFGAIVNAFGGDLNSEPVSVQITTEGVLSASLNMTLDNSVKLRTGVDADKLILQFKTLTGNINSQIKSSNTPDYQFSIVGGIKLKLSDGTYKGANTTFIVRHNSINSQNFVVDNFNSEGKFDLGNLKLDVSSLTLPLLSYDKTNGWDYKLLLNAKYNITTTGLTFNTPTVDGIAITKQGVTLPVLQMNDLESTSDAFTVNGFQIKTRNFRADSITIASLNGTNVNINNLGFSFDFSVLFSSFPTYFENGIRSSKLYVQNARLKNGFITSDNSSGEFYQSNRVNINGYQISIFKLLGKFGNKNNSQSFDLKLAYGGSVWSDSLLVSNTNNYYGFDNTSEIFIDGNGIFTGTGKIAGYSGNAPKIGYSKSTYIFNLTNANKITFSNQNGQKIVLSDSSNNCQLVISKFKQSQNPTTSVSSSVIVAFDLVNQKIMHSTFTFKNFRFPLPSDGPSNPLDIEVSSSGTFENGSFTITGTGNLVGENDKRFFGNFQEVKFDPSIENIVSGTINSSVPIGIHIYPQNGKLLWALCDTGKVPPIENAIVMRSNGSTLNSEGLSITNPALVNIRYRNQDYKYIRLVKEGNPVLKVGKIDKRLVGGKLKFMNGNEEIGFIDSTGISLTNMPFKGPPDQLALGDLKNAYLIFKSGGTEFVQWEAVSNGIRIRNKSGQSVKLVVPGLKYNQQTAPEFNLSQLDIVINTTTMGIVSGSVTLLPSQNQTQIVDLSDRGIPLKVTKLEYKNTSLGYILSVDGKTALPGVLANLETDLSDIRFVNGKLTGFANNGNYSSTSAPGSGYKKIANIGTMATFKMQGVEYDFGSNSSYKISGDIASKLFKQNNDTSIVHFTAVYQNSAFVFSASAASSQGLNIGTLKLVPQSVASASAVALTFTNDDFALVFNGVIKAPVINDNFASTIQDLTINKSGVVNSTDDSSQEFTMFAMTFSVESVDGAPAVTYSYLNDVFNIGMNGNLNFMDLKNVPFKNLQVSSAGTISFASGAGFQGVSTQSPVDVLAGRFNVKGLSLVNAGNKTSLKVTGDVTLPKPSQKTVTYAFEIPSGQTKSGDATYDLLDEAPALGGNDQTETTFWAGKYDVQYIGLKIDYQDFSASQILVNSRFYVDGKTDSKYIAFGSKSGGTVQPGLTMAFDNSDSWIDELDLSDKCDFEYKNLKYDLDNEDINFDTLASGGFKLTIGGTVGVAMTDMFEGKLNFSGLEVNSDSEVKNFSSSITGGSLQYKKILSVSIDKIGFSSSPTSIYVTDPSGAKNTEPGSKDSGTYKVDEVKVNFYFILGGKMSLLDAGGNNIVEGSVDSFLVYRKQKADGSDGDINFKIANFKFSKLDKFEFVLNMAMMTGKTKEDYLLSIAGMVKAGDIAMVAAGKFGKWDGQITAGIFLAVTEGLKLQVGPVTLVGLGGGFFWNPVDEDITSVKTLCGFGSEISSKVKDKIAKPGVGKPMFSVFIYGAAVIGSKTLIEARILLTVTDKKLNLDGKATLLERDDEIYGLISLEVGFEKFYAEGYIEAYMKLGGGKLLDGSGRIDFWYYSTKNWGITGTFDFKIAGGIIKANGDFYAGVKGLYVSLDIKQEFDVWIIAVKSGINLKAWYQPNVSWGAYFRIYVDVSVLGGIASAGGEIKGVLIGAPKFALAGVASLRVRLLMVSWDGDVWMRIEDGGFRAGFGKDAAVQRLIDKADKAAKAMLASLAEAKADMIANKPIVTLGITPEIINAASEELFKITVRARVLTAGDKLTQAEKDSINKWVKTEVPDDNTSLPAKYLNSLVSKILDKSESREAHRTQMTTLLDEVNTAINDYKTEVGKISTALSNYTLQVEVPGNFNSGNISNPVSDVGTSFFKKPTQVSSEPRPIDASFVFNSSVADANNSTVSTYMSSAVNYHDMLKRNMEKIETAITKFDDTFKKSGNTYLSVTDKYVALEAKVRIYTEHLAEYYFDDHKMIQPFFSTAVQGENNIPDDDYQKSEQGIFFELNKIARPLIAYERWGRINTLAKEENAWGKDKFTSKWDDKNLDRKEEFKKLGKQLYYELPKKAFASLDGENLTNLYKVREEYKTKMEQINELAVAYTRLLDDLFAKRRMMSESLFELTERFIYWKDQPKKNANDITDYKSLAPTVSDLNTKRTNLVASNTAPQLTINAPSYTNNKAYTSLNVNWSASHPNGIVDYAIYSSSSSTFSFGLPAGVYQDLSAPISIGKKTDWTAFGFPSRNDKVETDNIDFIVRARSGSGYTIIRKINFAGGVQRGFTNANMSQPIQTVQGIVTADNTPPKFTEVGPVGLKNYDSDRFLFNDLGTSRYENVKHYGTKNLNEIKVKLNASDAESGIKRYEYRVDLMRSSKKFGGGSDIDQLDAVSTVRDWTDIGLVDNYLIQGLNLQHNKKIDLSTAHIFDGSTRYVFRFRAYNGSNRASDFRAFAVFADTTKPAALIMQSQGLPYTSTKIDEMQNNFITGEIAKISAPLPAFVKDTTSRKIYFRFKLPEGQSLENIKAFTYRVYGMPDDVPVSEETVKDKLLNGVDNTYYDKVVVLPNQHSHYTGYKILMQYEEEFGGVSPTATSTVFHSGKAESAERAGRVDLKLNWFTGIPPAQSGNIIGGNVNLYFYQLAAHPDGIKKYQYQIRKDNGGEFAEWRDLPAIPEDRILRLDENFFQGSGINSGDAFTLRIRYVTYSNYTSYPLWYQGLVR